MKLNILIIFILFQVNVVFAQVNYDHINIQGQVLSGDLEGNSVNITLLVLGENSDTLWSEEHQGVLLSDYYSFSLIMGGGNYLSGLYEDLFAIDWMEVEQIKLIHSNPDVFAEVSIVQIQSTPYALHSLHTISVPRVVDMIDTPDLVLQQNIGILKYDGVSFNIGENEIADSATFALLSEQTLYSDTTDFSFYVYPDTSNLSLYTENSNYSNFAQQVDFSNNTTIADFSAVTLFSPGNWSLEGNTLANTNHFIGTLDTDSLIFVANNQYSLVFDGLDNINNDSEGKGFAIGSSKGIVFELDTGEVFTSITNTHMYFNGDKSLFHGGSAMDGLDTLAGKYSFSWGDNVGTNGQYSTIFGKNSFGDSTTIHDAYSSFAMGNNCHTTRTSVAIGLNAEANWYRNIAIGKDVFAGGASSSIALGDNVVSSGATAWAVGNNITASGTFSTALGMNASTNNKIGCFIYGDDSTIDTVFNTEPNQFMVRADGGLVFYSSSDLTMGTSIANGGGSWDMISDRHKKESIFKISGKDYSNAFNLLPIFAWNYKDQKELHIGPMAQDFYSTFRIGEYENYINMIDADGVVLMGIKQVNRKLDEVIEKKRIEKIANKITGEKEKLEDLEQKIRVLYEKMDF